MAAVAMALTLASTGAFAEETRFGLADPVVKDASQLDPKRPIEAEIERTCRMDFRPPRWAT